MNTLVTIFYSDYSGNCKAFLQRVKNNKEIKDLSTIKYINIDNQAIRKIVTKKFSIVPAVTVIVGNMISLYVGQNAFEWFTEFSENFNVADEKHGDDDEEKHGDDDEEKHDDEKKHGDDDEKKQQPNQPTLLEVAARIYKERGLVDE